MKRVKDFNEKRNLYGLGLLHKNYHSRMPFIKCKSGRLRIPDERFNPTIQNNSKSKTEFSSNA